jgi:WD40 repeat protein
VRNWLLVVVWGLTGCGAKAQLPTPADALGFSADGAYVVAGSQRGGALRVDAKGKAVELPVTAARWTLSDDGAVAIGATDAGFVVVDVATGATETLPVPDTEGKPWQMFRTRYGDIAVTKTVAFWRIHRWKPGSPTDPQPMSFDDLQGVWPDDGGGVFFVDTGYGLQVREVRTGRLVRTIDRRSDPQRYADAGLDEEGRLVTSLWDGDGFRLWAPPDEPAGLWNIREEAPVAFARGLSLAAVGTDQGVEIRSTSGQVLELLPTKSPVVEVALSADGASAAAGLKDGSVVVLKVSAQPAAVVDRPATDIDAGRIQLDKVPVAGAVLPPTQQHALGETPRLMRWGPDGKLQGWMSGDLVALDPFSGAVSGIDIRGLAPSRPFAWKGDGSLLAVMTDDGVELYAPGRRWRRRERLETGGGHSYLAWGGDTLVVDTDAAKVQAWSTETGQPLGEPFQVTARVLSGVSVSPDGVHLVTVGEDPAVYEVAGRKQVASLRAHLGRVSSVAWSPDGSQLATAGNDGVVFVWDTTSWTPTTKLEGLIGQSIHFGPGGGKLLVAGNTEARVVSLVTGDEEARLDFQGTLTSVDWGDLGTVIATNAGVLYLWP